ncbi:MAG: undecaprenyldiphospho-muramoylpentapeptide beta-N-acetylglucosaminyltransferase [Gammaproteobacteria bacterium]|nr:undecaprenyldiphospho-muramoylpentapeptide beta-N-acetylglucosaminyltransferase [Gammaproteobacteria bacterium]
MNRILVMAGGTGGHIFPALAVAEVLRASGCEVCWLGSRGGMEEQLVGQAGYAGDWIAVGGLRGKGWFTTIAAPLRLLVSLLQAVAVMIRRRPSVVLGMGGFASGPGGVAAWLLRRPLVVHEQNAVAGTTNRILARFARQVFSAFPDSFPGGRAAEVVGNPVRSSIIALPLPEQRMAARHGPIRVLVLGGSQGALMLNQYVPGELATLAATTAIAVHHQSGDKTHATACESYADTDLNVQVDRFIDDMSGAYAWADIVICRAGALTVSELAAAGLAAVLVPFPYAIDNHQAANAQQLVRLGAARVLMQDELKPGKLAAVLTELVADRKRLTVMATAARQLARPDAASRVADRCLRLAAGLSS